MRIWTIHPRYLDARGLLALWREGLLAQAVLRGKTKGYRHHPQLVRFLRQPSPIGAIAEYLRAVYAESVLRGYRFDAGKISRARAVGLITATRGQLEYEWHHLKRKLKTRDPERRVWLEQIKQPEPHPLFCIVEGSVENWEKVIAPLS